MSALIAFLESTTASVPLPQEREGASNCPTRACSGSLSVADAGSKDAGEEAANELKKQANDKFIKDVNALFAELLLLAGGRSPALLAPKQWAMGYEGQYRIYFELCEVTDLNSNISKLSPSQKTVIVYGIARCADHLHGLRIAGLDFSLDNIFLQTKSPPRPRLAGLQTARVFDFNDTNFISAVREDCQKFKKLVAVLLTNNNTSTLDSFPGQMADFARSKRHMSFKDISTAIENGCMFDGTSCDDLREYKQWFDRNRDMTYDWEDESPPENTDRNDPDWFLKQLRRAEEGEEDALVDVTMCYLFGCHVAKNYLMAVKYAKRSCKPVLAALRISSKTRKRGDGVTAFNAGQDHEASGKYQEALEEYKEASRAGDWRAVYRSAVLMIYVPALRDVEAGLKMLRQAHEKKVVDASFELGMLYKKGEFVLRDEEKALEYFKAAEIGRHSDAGRMVRELEILTGKRAC